MAAIRFQRYPRPIVIGEFPCRCSGRSGISRRVVFTPMPDTGIAPKRIESVEQLPDPAIGSFDVVRSGVFPGIIQIKVGISAEGVAAHPADFRHSVDFRCDRARASTGSILSPRFSASSSRPVALT